MMKIIADKYVNNYNLITINCQNYQLSPQPCELCRLRRSAILVRYPQFTSAIIKSIFK